MAPHAEARGIGLVGLAFVVGLVRCVFFGVGCGEEKFFLCSSNFGSCLVGCFHFCSVVQNLCMFVFVCIRTL